MDNRGFVIVSPVRNEEKCLQSTIDSVASQSRLPDEWIIVDDGSTDSTWTILEVNARTLGWMHPVKRTDRGFRQSGAGVVEAFYDGYDRLTSRSWEYMLKLDGDLSFDRNYFAACLDHFENEPQLGIGGGTICTWLGDGLKPESEIDPKFHVRGAVKIYRRQCWQAIGGLVRGPCWDSIDELRANMLGWTTRTFEELKVRHHRPAGVAFGKWKDWVKGGLGNYVTAYHPMFMVLKCLRRVPHKPIGFAACGLLYGYISGYLGRTPQLVDKELRCYIRRQQINRLLGRKSLWS